MATLFLREGGPSSGEPVEGAVHRKQVISWDWLETYSAKDTAITSLVNIISKGTPDDRDNWPENTN